jgi:hypothetical protein
VGVYLRYALGEGDEFEDGPDLATTAGWLAFLDWAEPLRDFPELARFSDECVCWPAEGIDRLEAELSEATRAHGDTLTPELLLTVTRLLQSLHERPGMASALIVTDGCDGQDDDEDADEDEDLDEDEDPDEDTDEGGESPTPAAGPATPAPETQAPADWQGLETGMPTPAAGAATPAQLKAAEGKRRLTGEPPASWQNDWGELGPGY